MFNDVDSEYEIIDLILPYDIMNSFFYIFW